MLIKKVSQFLKNPDIYTYLNLYYVINTMKTWFAKEDLKETGKKFFKRFFCMIFLWCLWWTIYSLVPYYWSVKVQDYYDMIRQNVKRWYTYDDILSNVLASSVSLTEWENINFDTINTINKESADVTTDYSYLKIFRYNHNRGKNALEVSISWNISWFGIENIWTNKHGKYDLPEFELIGFPPITWDQSCYLLRRLSQKWYRSEIDFDLLEEENPNNCIILNVTPMYQQGVAYLKFASDRKNDEPWYIKFHERPILRTHY